MKLSKLFLLFLLKLFLVEIFIIAISFVIMNSMSQSKSIQKALVSSPDTITSLKLFLKTKNNTALEMLLYKISEEKSLNSAEFISKLDRKTISRLDCRSSGTNFICKNGDKIEVFQPIDSTNKNLGYLKLIVKDETNIFNDYLYIVVFVLVLNLILTIVGVHFFINHPLQLELRNLIDSLRGSRDLKIKKSKISEYNIVLKNFNSLLKNLHNAQVEKTKLKVQAEKALIARQVAHDIRSPLEALKAITEPIDNIDYTSKKIMHNSIQRISSIANDLLDNPNSEQMANEETNLKVLLEDLIEEKITERGESITLHTTLNFSECFVNAHKIDLTRSISNILNNSIEACSNQKFCKVDITLSSDSTQQLTLTISDSGKGMTKELLKKVLSEQYTTKANGHGLGLSFALKTFKRLGFHYDIQSQQNQGTIITITMNQLSTPLWFAESITIPSQTKTIIAIDDDPGFLSLYGNKLKECSKPVTTIHPRDLEHYPLTNESCYFIDYDFGDYGNGLDLIEKYHLKNAYLVTSMTDDEKIKQRAVELGIRIIPKSLFNRAKTVSSLSTKSVIKKSAILIDDDSLMHLFWQQEAKAKNIKLSTYSTVDEFLENSHKHQPCDIIYIDSNLADDLKGEIESEKIYNAGFTHIHLATGYKASDFVKPSWIKSVGGKRPQFKELTT